MEAALALNELDNEKLPYRIQLTNGKSLIKHREICPRFFNMSKHRNKEYHYRRLLICYKPWRTNSDLLTNTSYENEFRKIKDRIICNVQKYEPYFAFLLFF